MYRIGVKLTLTNRTSTPITLFSQELQPNASLTTSRDTLDTFSLTVIHKQRVYMTVVPNYIQYVDMFEDPSVDGGILFRFYHSAHQPHTQSFNISGHYPYNDD
jgi:hypothetical protein